MEEVEREAAKSLGQLVGNTPCHLRLHLPIGHARQYEGVGEYFQIVQRQCRWSALMFAGPGTLAVEYPMAYE